MTIIIVGAAIFILCGAALGFLFSPDDFPRGFTALWGGGVVAFILFWVGVAVVAVHFAGKYW